jgi:hypothetical protein
MGGKFLFTWFEHGLFVSTLWCQHVNPEYMKTRRNEVNLLLTGSQLFFKAEHG